MDRLSTARQGGPGPKSNDRLLPRLVVEEPAAEPSPNRRALAWPSLSARALNGVAKEAGMPKARAEYLS